LTQSYRLTSSMRLSALMNVFRLYSTGESTNVLGVGTRLASS